MHFPKELTTVF
ncbi:aminotransferase class I and II family protein, partial [Yersinia pestis PY-54]